MGHNPNSKWLIEYVKISGVVNVILVIFLPICVVTFTNLLLIWTLRERFVFNIDFKLMFDLVSTQKFRVFWHPFLRSLPETRSRQSRTPKLGPDNPDRMIDLTKQKKILLEEIFLKLLPLIQESQLVLPDQ